MVPFVILQVKEVAPEARRRDAMLSFAFVYPDKRGRFVVREVSGLVTNNCGFAYPLIFSLSC